MATDVAPLPDDLEPISEGEALKAAPVAVPQAAPAAAPRGAPILDPADDLEPVSEKTAKGSYVDNNGQPLKRFQNMEAFYGSLVNRMNAGEINSEDEAQAFADDFAPTKVALHVAETLAARDKGAHITNEYNTDYSLVNWIQHLRHNGVDTRDIDALPARDQLALAQQAFANSVAEYAKKFGLPDHPERASALDRFAWGVKSSVGDMIDGLHQLGYRAADITGIMDHAKAETGFDAVAYENAAGNAALVHGTAGRVGKFAGEVATSALVPVAAPEVAAVRFPRLAAVVARAGGGAAIGAMQPSDTMDQQTGHILTNAALMPFMIPIVNILGAKLGQAGTSAYLNLVKKVSGQGVGSKVFDASGNLTALGRTLRARFIGAGAPEDVADQTLHGIAGRNPAQIAGDRSAPIEVISEKEGVPLPKGVKTQDARQMQTLETAEAGAYGKPVQDKAIRASTDTDRALLGNVESLGTGASRAEASENAAHVIHAAEGEASSAVDAKYKALETSAEPLSRSGQAALQASLHDVYEDLGQAGVDTLSPRAKAFAAQITAMAKSKTPPRFGQIWQLSRQVNRASRELYGTSDGVDIGRVKQALDNWMESSAPGHFKMGSNGVIRQLQSANTDYKALMDNFGNRPDRLRGGGKIADPVGRSVATIVQLVKQSGPDGLRPGSDIATQVERQIFGPKKTGFSPEAANTVRHIAEVAPEAVPHIRDIYVSRLADEITEAATPGGVRGAIKPVTMQRAISDVVNNNRAGLSALGMSDTEIQSLANNGWLSSLKILPPGARNIGSGKWNRALITGFRRAFGILGAGLGFELSHHGLDAGLGHAGPVALGAVAGEKLARTVENRVALDAISGKVPRAASEVGQRRGKMTLKALAKGGLAAGDQSQLGRD